MAWCFLWIVAMYQRLTHTTHTYDIVYINEFRTYPWFHRLPLTACCAVTKTQGGAMIHVVLHDAKDTVAVAVVEGIEAGTELNAWIMDEDKVITVVAKQPIPIGHK